MATEPNGPKRDTPPTTERDNFRVLAAASNPGSMLMLAIKASRNDCSCEICAYLREFADLLASVPLSAPKSPPTPPGGS